MSTHTQQWLSLGLLLFAAGCSGAGAEDPNWPARTPVTGEVLYKGQPVEGATVIFSPTENGYPGIARTDAEGRFELQTFRPGDGAVPGLFQVAVRKVEVAAAQPASDDSEGLAVGEKSLLPVKYADPKFSGLTATVVAGSDDTAHFKFELQEGPLTAAAAGQRRYSSGGE
jgi:hypothetical protein